MKIFIPIFLAGLFLAGAGMALALTSEVLDWTITDPITMGDPCTQWDGTLCRGWNLQGWLTHVIYQDFQSDISILTYTVSFTLAGSGPVHVGVSPDICDGPGRSKSSPVLPTTVTLVLTCTTASPAGSQRIIYTADAFQAPQLTDVHMWVEGEAPPPYPFRLWFPLIYPQGMFLP